MLQLFSFYIFTEPLLMRSVAYLHVSNKLETNKIYRWKSLENLQQRLTRLYKECVKKWQNKEKVLQRTISWGRLTHRTIYQCCGSGMFILDPGSWFLPISDPGSKNSYKREGWKKVVVIQFFVATNFKKCKIILFLNCWRKKFGPNFKQL